ncbi:LAMI_0F12728g1_1 [Lachancea mirantina]|uniref:LAMI_0F12728g1_1 n=1 Tax=Lachancea mirantina TaxID=1230905 RepID=A0A1G4K313_9SACH|nr:LAMI_0F12728g1_1 [Lachancea mirantina]
MLLERIHNRLHGVKSRSAKNAAQENENEKRRLSLLAETAEQMAEEDMSDADEMMVDSGAIEGTSGREIDHDAASSRRDLNINTQLAQMSAFGQHTPVMTPTMQPINPYVYMNNRRQDSVASLASSVSDVSHLPATAPRSQLNGAPFTNHFVALLMDAYQDVCSDPTVTPFDALNPPSGILNRTAKVAVERADMKEIEIGREKNAWLVTAVRQRLLQEIRKDEYLSRNSSIVSLPPVPQFNGADGMPLAPSDYFNINTDFSSQHSFPLTASLGPQQPLQSPFEHRPVISKTVPRARTDSFISAAGRSRSGSNLMFSMPQQNVGQGVQQNPILEHNVGRSRSGSTGFFMLTPMNSHAPDVLLPTLSRQRSCTSTTLDDMISSETMKRRRDLLRTKSYNSNSMNTD